MLAENDDKVGRCGTVLHVVTDYPGTAAKAPTKAVYNLVQATSAELGSFIVAVERRGMMFKLKEIEGGLLVTVPKLPLGILINTFLYVASMFVVARLTRNHIKFDVVHGHKLTIDGVLAYYIAENFRTPLLLSIRGNTDVRFVRFKYFSRHLYRKILRRGDHVFWVSLWAKARLFQLLRVESVGPCSPLPNICPVDARSSGTLCPFVSSSDQTLTKSQFLFVGRLRSAKKKGLYAVLRAIRKDPSMALDVVGHGSFFDVVALKTRIKLMGLQSRVKVLGHMSHSSLFKVLPDYCAVAMPSKNETFGMIYVEALLLGVPVLCGKGSGVDGYFEESSYARFAAPDRCSEIYEQLNFLRQKCDAVRLNLAADKSEGYFQSFSSAAIGGAYINTVKMVACSRGRNSNYP